MHQTDNPAGLSLGIDGGGSKTVALLADCDGRVIGRGVGGASNYNVIGAGKAFAALEGAVLAAFADARVEMRVPRSVCLGMAGVDRPDDRALFGGWAGAQWPGAAITLVNDAELVLAAGTPDGWGLALICGTGSIVYGCDREGQKARAGGWGYLFGDEGSGYAIGLAALRAVARAADGRGTPTGLAAAVLERWSLAQPQDLIRRVYVDRASTAEIAALAGLVDEAAAAGDAVARDILAEAGRELALALEAVARQLQLVGPTPCALAGGLIVNRPALAAHVLEAAAALGLALDPVVRVDEPARGAVRLAAQALRGGM